MRAGGFLGLNGQSNQINELQVFSETISENKVEKGLMKTPDVNVCTLKDTLVLTNNFGPATWLRVLRCLPPTLTT